MKKLIQLALLAFLISPPATSWAAISIGVHTAAANASGTHVTSVTTSAVTTQATGSIFVILVASNGYPTATTPVTDATTGCASPCNTYTLVASLTSFYFASSYIYAYVCETSCVGGAGHTATGNITTAWAMSVHFVEIKGAATSSVVDTSGTLYNGNTAATSQPGAPVTSTNANDLILSYIALANGGNATISDTSGWNALLDASNPAGTDSSIMQAADSYKIVSSTGTYSDTYTLSAANNGGGLAIAFKAAAAPVVNGVVMSNGHPVKSGSSVLYQ